MLILYKSTPGSIHHQDSHFLHPHSNNLEDNLCSQMIAHGLVFYYKFQLDKDEEMYYLLGSNFLQDK